MKISVRAKKIVLIATILVMATVAMDMVVRRSLSESEKADGVLQFVETDRGIHEQFGVIHEAHISQQILQGSRARYRVTIDGEKADGTIFVAVDRLANGRKYEWGAW